MRISADELRKLSIDIFTRAGVPKPAAVRVSEHLVSSNLAGVDSHGAIRIPQYVQRIRDGEIDPSAQSEIVNETPSTALIDGHWAFGQVVAFDAVQLAIDKAKAQGISIVSVRNSTHIGRLGEYAEIMANDGLIGFIAVNGQGAGQFVAPSGARERRLSVNPMAWGIPTGRPDEPFVLDISTAAVAEGKIRVKRNRGEAIPEGWVIDAEGKPTTNPADLYGPPEGCLLPMGGHKGYGLSLVVDMLAGGLSGGGCSRPNVKRFGNAIVIIAVDPSFIRPGQEVAEAVGSLIDYVKSAQPAKEGAKVMVPNEIELQTRRQRLAEGIEIEDETWNSIAATARELGIEL
ncbi:MAG: Ldh family oxidoreductase [Firmicutes bacterium]|nr:Ldh family oxidoreductase [Bacillota bacterium]